MRPLLPLALKLARAHVRSILTNPPRVVFILETANGSFARGEVFDRRVRAVDDGLVAAETRESEAIRATRAREGIPDRSVAHAILAREMLGVRHQTLHGAFASRPQDPRTRGAHDQGDGTSRTAPASTFSVVDEWLLSTTRSSRPRGLAGGYALPHVARSQKKNRTTEPDLDVACGVTPSSARGCVGEPAAFQVCDCCARVDCSLR